MLVRHLELKTLQVHTSIMIVLEVNKHQRIAGYHIEMDFLTLVLCSLWVASLAPAASVLTSTVVPEPMLVSSVWACSSVPSLILTALDECMVEG